MGNVNMEASQINYRNNSKKSVRTVENALDNLYTKSDTTAQDIIDLTAAMTAKADKIDIAPTFNEETAYFTDDLVFQSGRLWKFVANHTPGEWNQEEVEATNIDKVIRYIESGLAVETESYTTPISNTYSRKYGKIVTISIEYGAPIENLSAGSGVTLGKLPSEYRPTGSDDRYISVCIAGNTGSQLCAARLTVKRDGDMVLIPGSAISSGTHMFMSVSYII